MDGNVVVSPIQTQLSFFSFVDGCVFSRLTVKIEHFGWMKKSLIHSQIWDGMMNCDIYIYRERERERRKKTPSKFGFHGWKCCGFPKTLKLSFLGGWKNVFINPQIWDEMMECGIYIYIYIYICI
jgi:hypothetical protein